MRLFVLIFIYSVFQTKTPTEIAESLKPKDSKIVHKIIQSPIWKKQNTIIAFYETRYDDEQQKKQFVEGYLLVPTRTETYQKVLIDKYEDDNVDTEVESVFFANADKDKEKELIVISSIHHRLQYLYEGTEYQINIYDNINMSVLPKRLELLDLSIEGGFEGYSQDESSITKSHAKFKNAEAVKKELKRLGF